VSTNPTPETSSERSLTGCGARLRQAREAAGLSLEQAARRVHLTMRVLSALEAENWEQLGAPIFVRGQLRSYAHILGLEADELLEQAHLAQLQSPMLHSGMVESVYPSEMRPRIGRSLLMALVMLILIAPVLWKVLQSPDEMNLSSAISSPSANTPIVSEEQPLIEFTHIAPLRPETDENDPDTEALSSMSAERVSEFEDEIFDGDTEIAELAVVTESTPFLSLSFKGDSWVEIRSTNGSLLESGIINAGQVRQFESGQVSRIKLGNASAVEVRQAGELIETSRLGRGNVVHFRVSLDGSVQPVAAQ